MEDVMVERVSVAIGMKNSEIVLATRQRESAVSDGWRASILSKVVISQGVETPAQRFV
jgi:hypothetical protein